MQDGVCFNCATYQYLKTAAGGDRQWACCGYASIGVSTLAGEVGLP